MTLATLVSRLFVLYVFTRGYLKFVFQIQIEEWLSLELTLNYTSYCISRPFFLFYFCIHVRSIFGIKHLLIVFIL